MGYGPWGFKNQIWLNTYIHEHTHTHTHTHPLPGHIILVSQALPWERRPLMVAQLDGPGFKSCSDLPLGLQKNTGKLSQG